MTTDSALSPDVVAAIDDLEVAARVVVDGMRSGSHRSPLLGPGAEFQQHRPYRAGDDIRHLDWKLFARSDRLYTRQYRETTDLAVGLVLDTSPSMAFPPEGVSKLRYGKVLAASLAYLATQQGNAVGLTTGGPDGLQYVPARTGTLHRSALVARLDAATATAPWPAVQAVRHATELMKRRGMLVVISDFYDDEDAVLRELSTAAHRGHDVIMVQLLSDAELDLDLARDVELEDLESHARRVVDPRVVRDAYRRQLAAFLARCRDGAGSAGVDYALVRTSTPPEQALRELLLRRVR